MKKTLLLISLILFIIIAASACGEGSNGESGSSDYDTSASITVVVREDGSGTKSAFMEIIGLEGKADQANATIQTSTEGVLAEVRGNPTAIAYESLGYVTDDVKTLKIDGVEATVDNIKTGDYRISRPLSLVYQDEILDSVVNNSFYIFLQSSDAFEIINDNGYVTVLNASAPYMIDDTLAGTINISGSTSMQPLMSELAQKYVSLQPNVTVNVVGSDSGQGYSDAEDGLSEFGMISEEFKFEKAPSCVSYVVCKDGIAIIVHKDNPLDSITIEQLRSVYNVDAGANAASNWDDLINPT